MTSISELFATPSEILARMRSDLALGVPVFLQHGTEALVFVAIETLEKKRFLALSDISASLLIALTRWRAETLKLRAYFDDLAICNMPSELSLAQLKALGDPVSDLAFPIKGPFTEPRAAPDELFRRAIALCKSARLLPAVLGAVVPMSELRGLNLSGLLAAQFDDALRVGGVANVVAAHVPIRAFAQTRLHVFRPDEEGVEHYVVQVGEFDPARPVLTRMHSACFTGDVLGSLKCDCGPQLHAALEQMAAEGSGLLLYLNQEGRGIGLRNKMRAYALQDQGFDTVDANHRLGFEDDERNFTIGAELLRKMNVSQVRLMTNNPKKCDSLMGEGIEVIERVPLVAGKGPLNRDYMATKAAKSGHLL